MLVLSVTPVIAFEPAIVLVTKLSPVSAETDFTNVSVVGSPLKPVTATTLSLLFQAVFAPETLIIYLVSVPLVTTSVPPEETVDNSGCVTVNVASFPIT